MKSTQPTLFSPVTAIFLIVLVGLLGIILQGFMMQRLLHRYGEARLVVFGLLGMACGYALLSQAQGIVLTLIAASLSGVGHGLTRPSLTSLISQAADPREQGSVLGASQSLQSLAQIVAPLLGGYLVGRGWTPVWALCASGFACFGLALGKARVKTESVT